MIKQILVFVPVSVEDELPAHEKHVFSFSGKTPYTSFHTKGGTKEVEFENDEDFDWVQSDGNVSTLKEGWYEECENIGHYDSVIHKRVITHWLKEETKICLTKDQLIDVIIQTRIDFNTGLEIVDWDEYISSLNIK
jgi:hypothetical protein